jgi:hypothetical protein
MNRHKHIHMLSVFLVAMVALILSAAATEARAKKKGTSVEVARIFFEFNSSAGEGVGDLGVHVFLDGEDWKKLEIVNPKKRTIFEVEGKGPYKELGMTELFFEGAEPSLDEVPLEELLALFPDGEYKFIGKTVDGERIMGTATLTHAIPAGPVIVSPVEGQIVTNSLVIRWKAVTSPPPGFPNEPIKIVAYQVIVGAFQVTVPATSASMQSVTVSPQFVKSLAIGLQLFEVLAIEAGGNQTITEGSFIKK